MPSSKNWPRLLREDLDSVGSQAGRKNPDAMNVAFISEVKMKLKIAIVAALGSVVLASGALSQETTRSVWEGVYTVAQSKRGQSSFGTNCATCHGEALDGSESGPSLADKDFMLVWDGHTVAELLDRIHDTMPADHPGKLSRGEAADITAYILAFNKFPAGTAELSPQAEALKQIRIDPKKPER
jgi:mono/diheme cytochrome c family protein